METKYVRVPFEVELAKRIQNKECDGKILDTYYSCYVRIVDFNFQTTQGKLNVGISERGEGKEVFATFNDDGVMFLDKEGKFEDKPVFMLEIPEYMTFKDGDVVAFGDKYTFIGIFKSSWAYNESHSDYVVLSHEDRLMFDGDAWTYNNARFATESEKKKLIDALKSSKDQRAKKYVKLFFPNHSNSSNTGKYCEFEPKDWILCRSGKNEWTLCQFSHIHKRTNQCVSVNGLFWDIFIPYNEQTAHLLGTTKNPD